MRRGRPSDSAAKDLDRRGFIRGAAATALISKTIVAAPAVHASENALRIGAVLPLTGNLSLFGQQARLGLEVARSEINTGGGVLGRAIEIDYNDDVADPARAEKAAKALTADKGLLAIAGPVTSASRNAISPTMIASGTPLLYATNYEGGDCGNTLFYFNSVPNQVADPLLNYLLDTAEGGYFMLGADYVYPIRVFDSCAKVIESRGGTIVGRRFIPLQGLSDYGPVVDEVRSSGAGAVLLALPGTPHEDFVAAADRGGLFPKVALGLLDTVALYTRSEQAAKSINAFGCVPFVETDPSAGTRKFVERARAIAGKTAVISAYAVTHYNAMMALKAGCEKAGSVTREAAISGMSGLEYNTPNGPLNLDPTTRHTTLRMHLTKVDKDGLRLVQEPETIAPRAACVAGD